MCFIISIVLLVLSYKLYLAGSILLSLFSFAVSIFFIILMVKNIRYIKSLKNEKKVQEDDN